MAQYIPNENCLYRSIVSPVAFRGKAFDCEKFLHITPLKNGMVHASMAWERFLPNISDVHLFGCRLAAFMNKTKPPKKDKDRKVYCGFYAIVAKSVRELAELANLSEVRAANAIHLPENGEIAHVDIAISVEVDDPDDMEDTKTAIIVALWNKCKGPAIHACECDHGVQTHPNAKLFVPPCGKFVERS